MEKYLEKYPNEFSDIMALKYSLGFDEVNEICNEALRQNKRIYVETDPNKLDYITYKIK